MYGALVPLVGALISVMSSINSRLSLAGGILAATVVIHVAGLAGISVVLAVRGEPRLRQRLPLYRYAGGALGVGTVFSTIYAFGQLGAALAVALALLGQVICSAVVDATGFLGRPRYSLTARAIPGLLLAAGGVVLMAWASPGASVRVTAPAIVIALVAGAIPGITFVLNSELGRAIGAFRSTRMNYITGLSTSACVLLVAWAAAGPGVHPGDVARALLSAGPFLLLGGGLMGVMVVTSMNLLMPRVPALSATLLLFAGQAFAGVLIDLVTMGVFDAWKLVGTCVLLAGLALNSLLAPPRTARG